MKEKNLFTQHRKFIIYSYKLILKIICLNDLHTVLYTRKFLFYYYIIKIKIININNLKAIYFNTHYAFDLLLNKF